MERWVIYAFICMLFAGLTSVIAKQGLVGISAELGWTVRTLFVLVFIIVDQKLGNHMIMVQHFV